MQKIGGFLGLETARWGSDRSVGVNVLFSCGLCFVWSLALLSVAVAHIETWVRDFQNISGALIDLNFWR